MCAGFPPCIFAFYSRPVCSKTLPQTGTACLVFTVFSVGPTPPHPHPQQPPPPTPSQPAGGDAALLQITQIQTRFICSASDLIGHRALKKSLLCFFLLCMFPHSSSRATSDVRVCVRVCIVTLKAARAPLFQMTLFTDTTQPPRIPRQNLISREHHDSGVSAEREIQVTNYGTFFNYVEILLHQCCNRAGN